MKQGIKGFTVIELVLALILASILATLTITAVRDNDNAIRYEETRVKLEALRQAIVGDDTLDEQGHRIRYGYHGDMGHVPKALDSLLVRGSQPAFTFNSYYGMGWGWRGPYINPDYTAMNIDKDAWGTLFSYGTGPTTPTITSYGSDKTVGGLIYAKDLTISFPDERRFSSLTGVVSDGGLRVGTALVEFKFAQDGVMASVFSTSNVDGRFFFNTVPLGVRALRVVGPNPLGTLGPARVSVDQPYLSLPEHTLNFFGRAGLALESCAGGGTATLTITFTSRHPSARTIEYVTVTHDKATTLTSVNVNGGVAESIPNISSGTKIRLRTAYTITGRTTGNTLALTFSGVMASAGNLVVTLEWGELALKDTIRCTF